MSTNALRKYGGWVALVAGSIEILGLGFLVLFFAVELPQGIATTLPFGYLSDVTPIIAAPVNLFVVVILFLLQRKDSRGLGAIAATLGIAGILLTAWTNIRFISETITLEQQIQLFYASLALLGPWHILVNSFARREGFLPTRLTMFGILVGGGQVLMFILSFVLGGYDDVISSSPAALMTNIPLLISLAIGIPLALLGYFGAPIWLVWLGRTLIREDRRMQFLNKLEASS